MLQHQYGAGNQLLYSRSDAGGVSVNPRKTQKGTNEGFFRVVNCTSLRELREPRNPRLVLSAVSKILIKVSLNRHDVTSLCVWLTDQCCECIASGCTSCRLFNDALRNQTMQRGMFGCMLNDELKTSRKEKSVA